MVPAPILALLTDFGTRDWYVAAMKGVILGICPEAQLVDISHHVPPQDIVAGAYQLDAAAGHFPERTVFVVVVDPGVGSDRRAIAVRAKGRAFVGPDNGVMAPAIARMAGDDAVVVRDIGDSRFCADRISSTFHGRDVFAPVAAHIALGVAFADIGSPGRRPAPLDRSVPSKRGGVILGEIVDVDHFGNLITNIPGEWLEASSPYAINVHEGGSEADFVVSCVRNSYVSEQEGAPLIIVGSSGSAEVSICKGSAAQALNVTAGARCRLERLT